MKDFKQNTKMACQGKHYQAGGDVTMDDLATYAKKNPSKPTAFERAPRPATPDVNLNRAMGAPDNTVMQPVEMPYRKPTDMMTSPVDGKLRKMAPPQIRGNLLLLKKGGKTKRGNKK